MPSPGAGPSATEMTRDAYDHEPNSAARKIRGDAAELPLHERSRYRAAAGHARRVYPGPIGELAYRELILDPQMNRAGERCVNEESAS